MIDGCHEFLNGTMSCDKCEYGDWTQAEINEREDMMREDECGCHGGCGYCLMLESRSYK
jgi:hypothetical protein